MITRRKSIKKRKSLVAPKLTLRGALIDATMTLENVLEWVEKDGRMGGKHWNKKNISRIINVSLGICGKALGVI